MPPDAQRFDSSDPDFENSFAAFLDRGAESGHEVDGVVVEIIADVRRRGDAALVDYTNRFDRNPIDVDGLAVPAAEIEQAAVACDPAAVEALAFAAARIRAFHEPQKPADAAWTDTTGVRLGWRWTPIDAVGLYVPGGRAAYPSSVLMNAIPAKVAGVPRLVMTVPAPDGHLNPLVLAAAQIAGVDQIFRVGGAQAVAALAYGTKSIAPVDKIVGPGNAYVTAAKRQVFGRVGIDMIAGPSEILVVADGLNDPAWIAADLLSQAEHDPLSQATLITDDAGFADRVADAASSHLRSLPRRDIAGASWQRFGAIIVVKDLTDAPALVNRIAPEHLELAIDDPERLLDAIRHAGAIFLGKHTPEAVGDYVGGPNHVLPTSRAARFASGLGVQDFMKRTTLLGCDPASLAEIGPAAMVLANAEGLHAHALSIASRTNRR